MQQRRWVGAAVIALTVLAVPSSGVAQPALLTSSTAMPKRLRIALVPLDDRPVCLQYPQMMAGLALAEVVAPPIAVLGRFTTPGDTAAIARWLHDQDWRTVDALIVSTDMLAYGGLVASRVHRVEADVALARLRVLEEIRRAHPALPIYGFSVIMRLAPTADGTNEAWREKLARHAELGLGPHTPAEAEEIAGLVQQIPATAREGYLETRTRNLRVNLAAVELAARRVFDYLVVSQDDARPRGLHLVDRAEVTAQARTRGVAGRVAIQPGADEVAMLLLARAVLERRGLTPTMRATYSTERARTMIAPFEDRPLHETVDFQIAAAGASAVRGTHTKPDLDLFVFASRHEDGVPTAFARQIVAGVGRGARAIVADVDPKGDVQGASAAFTEALLSANVLPRLYGYASWNTAGNTLGTAIAHGLLAWAGARLAMRCTSPAFTAWADAQATFVLHRLVNDYAWQGVTRRLVNADLRKQGRNPLLLEAHAAHVAARIQDVLAPMLLTYSRQFAPVFVPPSPGRTDVAVQVDPPRNLQVRLPWARTFEAAITFDVDVRALSGPARRLPACTVASQ